MFDIGFQEITLIGVIALIVVGPERLPKMARTLGLWMGKIRFYVNQVKSDIDREVRAQELKEMLDKPARDLEDVYKVAEETKGALGDAKGALGDAKASLEKASDDSSTPAEPAAGSIFPPAPSVADGQSKDGGSKDGQSKDGQSTTADSTPDPQPESTVATETDGPENAGELSNARDLSNDHETTAVTAAAGDDDERTSRRV